MDYINPTDSYVRELHSAADDLETLATTLREFDWITGGILQNSRDLRIDEIKEIQRTITDITMRVSPYRS